MFFTKSMSYDLCIMKLHQINYFWLYWDYVKDITFLLLYIVEKKFFTEYEHMYVGTFNVHVCFLFLLQKYFYKIYILHKIFLEIRILILYLKFSTFLCKGTLGLTVISTVWWYKLLFRLTDYLLSGISSSAYLLQTILK